MTDLGGVLVAQGSGEDVSITASDKRTASTTCALTEAAYPTALGRAGDAPREEAAEELAEAGPRPDIPPVL
jgi:hypothetical protein